MIESLSILSSTPPNVLSLFSFDGITQVAYSFNCFGTLPLKPNSFHQAKPASLRNSSRIKAAYAMACLIAAFGGSLFIFSSFSSIMHRCVAPPPVPVLVRMSIQIIQGLPSCIRLILYYRRLPLDKCLSCCTKTCFVQ